MVCMFVLSMPNEQYFPKHGLFAKQTKSNNIVLFIYVNQYTYIGLCDCD